MCIVNMSGSDFIILHKKVSNSQEELYYCRQTEIGDILKEVIEWNTRFTTWDYRHTSTWKKKLSGEETGGKTS